MPVSISRVRPTVARRSGLALVLLVAFVLRVWNLDWDEGTHQHPDERYWSIVTADISAPGLTEYFDSTESSLNPYNHRDTWVYGTLPLFVNKAAASFLADGPFPAGAIVTTADTLGVDLRNDGVDAFDAGYNANLVGRLLSALLDTATVAMVYLLGRDLFDRRTGFVAATLVAFAPLHIQYAHFFGAEPWVTFFVTAGIWMSVKLARGDLRIRTAVATGTIFGMAVASKLIAAAALVVPATAILVAVMPSVLHAGRTAAERARAWSRADPQRAWATAIAVSAALVVLIVAPQVSLGTVARVILVGGAAAVVVYALGVVHPALGTGAGQAAHIHTGDGDEQRRDARVDPVPPFHVTAWGAFVGGVVVATALVTYRVLQPYTFDGLLSIDPRFSGDLDYLQDVNSGGNVPWVVQWIGRTPLLFPLTSAFWWGMGPAMAIASVVGVGRACVDVVRGRRWLLLLPLVYLAMMLGLVSQQFNPLIRYLLPAYPAAIVLGGHGVVSMWDAGRRRVAAAASGARATGHALRIAAVALVAASVLWGLAFVNGVYNTDHPRIEASRWMAENLPDGAVLSTQIWDDSLPLPISGTEEFGFTHVALDPFQPDRVPGKVDTLIAGLDQVDYVVEASNRLYDSIPRVPARYPATTAYYEALFDGRLGFEQVAQFRNSPSLFGIDIPDHFAEETFTVYDHPTVTIWAKTAAWSPRRAAAILNPAAAEVAPDLIPSEAAANALLLRPDDSALAETGATFDEAFEPRGALGSFPWIWWLVWLQLCAFAVLPWTTRLFSGLPDKGYGPAKAIGFVIVGLATWLTVSWGVADYGRALIWTWFGVTALTGMVAWSRNADRMTELWRTHRPSWLATEVVFLAVFGLALWMRSANPDLWEAYLGGEKPMEMAYITAIARSSDFPAVDPWFAGGYMNYYYFGWYLLTVPMRALRIAPEIGFNLGVATYAALTASVAFSVVHNLVGLSRRYWGPPRRRMGGTDPDPDRTPVRAGLLGVVLLMGIGNLDAIRLHYDRLAAVNEWDVASGVPIIGHIVTFLGGTWQWLTGTPLARFDWWAPSRVNRGNFDITEFPYFTFLFGDLHPHMMGMVFVGLVVTTAIAHLVASRDGNARLALATTAGLGVLTGAVRAVNTWDLPSTLILTGAAVVVGRAIAPPRHDERSTQRPLAVLVGALALAAGLSVGGGPGGTALLALIGIGLAALIAAVLPVAPASRVLSGVAHLCLAGIVHVALFWPYLRSNVPLDTGLESAVAGSPLDDFLVHWGIFLVLAAALALALVTDARRRRRVGRPSPGPLPDVVWASPLWRAGWASAAAVLVLATGRISTGAATISVAGVIVFGALLLVELRRDRRDIGRVVAVGLFALGFAIAGGVDVVTVQNDIERMNTVFKFWLQSWQYFALGGAFAVWQVDRVLRERTETVIEPGEGTTVRIGAARPWRGTAWGVAVGVLVLAGLAYPLLGTRTRLETRFARIPVTLDGLAYLHADPEIRRIGPDGEGEISVRLAEDLPLIEWIRANVAGQPGLVEWAGAGYDWNARIAIHTGLPTVLGWDWHQKQQRWNHQELVDQRLRAVSDFYTAGNEATITRFLQAYDVRYVIVGTQERRFGRPAALEAIASHPALDPVFVSGENTVYRVDRAALWPGVDVDALELEALGG